MLSSISLFSFERGNIIYLAVINSIFFLVNYQSENKIIREMSFIALAIAAALKGFPALLGILLLYDKRHKEAIRLIVHGVIFSFLPFCFS